MFTLLPAKLQTQLCCYVPDIIKELEVAVESGHMDVVENQVHKVKNMAGEAGGVRLYFLCLLR